LTLALEKGSKVRSVFPVAGFMLEMLMINRYASLRVPEISLGGSKKRNDEQPFQKHLIYIVVLCPQTKFTRSCFHFSC
jgi:hypothetical protein